VWCADDQGLCCVNIVKGDKSSVVVKNDKDVCGSLMRRLPDEKHFARKAKW
jgi:hypothetical protein